MERQLHADTDTCQLPEQSMHYALQAGAVLQCNNAWGVLPQRTRDSLAEVEAYLNNEFVIALRML